MSPAAQRPEDENLGVAANLMYGLQHVLTMYGGIVAVPLIVAEAVWQAANDVSGKLHFPAGADAVALSRAA